MDLLALKLLDIAISWERSAVKGVEGRLSTNVLRSGRSSPGWRWPRFSPVNVDIDVDVPVDDRLAAVRSKRLVGYLRRRWLMEEIVLASGGPAEEIVIVIPLPLHDARSTACAVFVDINIAVVTRGFVVLLEAEMVIVVSTASVAATAAASAVTTAWRTTPHAFKPRAIPALTSTSTTAGRCRRVVIAIQSSCGRTTVHG